jgi:hypothetical protein
MVVGCEQYGWQRVLWNVVPEPVGTPSGANLAIANTDARPDRHANVSTIVQGNRSVGLGNQKWVLGNAAPPAAASAGTRTAPRPVRPMAQPTARR